MGARAAVGWAAAGLLWSGCLTMDPRVGAPAPRVADTDAEAHYKEVLTKWTRRGELYQKLDLRLYMAATLESAEFRTARTERMAVFHSQPPEDVLVALQQEMALAQGGYEFLMGVHVDNPQWNDFDRDTTIWRVSLVGPGGEVTAAGIERVGRPDVNLRGIYTYLSDFWTAYRVRFPTTRPDGRPLLGAGDKQLTLRVSSAAGKLDLVFDAVPVGGAGTTRVNMAPVP